MKKVRAKILYSIFCIVWLCNTTFAVAMPPVPVPSGNLQKGSIQKTQEKAPELKPAIKNQASDPNEIILSKDELPVQKINSKQVTKVDAPLFETDKDQLAKIFDAQKKQDREDLDKLWYSTMDRNSAIKFAVQKLSIPPEQLKTHSSLMARSISTLISGAALVPYMVGAGYSAQTLSLAGGQIASRLVEKTAMPKKMPLTDTELIQLSELVENLQNRVIKNYYGYKSSINELKNCRQKLMVEHKNYSDAIENNDTFYIVVSSALYDDQLLEEIKIKQKIKQYRLELERLAGEEAVAALNLNAVVYNPQPDVK